MVELTALDRGIADASPSSDDASGQSFVEGGVRR